MKHTFHLSKNNDEYHFSIHRCNRLGENDQWYSFIFDSEDMETLRKTVSLEDKTSARHELWLKGHTACIEHQSKKIVELEKLEATVISLAIGVDKLETDAVSQRTVNSVLQKAVVDDRKRVEALEKENADALKAHATRGLLLKTMLTRLEDLEKFKEDHIKYDAKDRADLMSQCAELRFRCGSITMALNDNHEEIHRIKNFLEMKI